MFAADKFMDVFLTNVAFFLLIYEPEKSKGVKVGCIC